MHHPTQAKMFPKREAEMAAGRKASFAHEDSAPSWCSTESRQVRQLLPSQPWNARKVCSAKKNEILCRAQDDAKYSRSLCDAARSRRARPWLRLEPLECPRGKRKKKKL